MSEKQHRIGIVGGGAVGLAYAAFLAETAEVLIKTRSQAQAADIKKHGLSLTLPGEPAEHITGIDASASPSALADCDAVLITVKSYDTEKVAREIAPHLKPDAEVVSLQNGLQGFAILQANIKNPSRVFAGVTYIGATRTDGHSIALGYNRRSVVDSHATICVAALKNTRFGVEASSDIRQTVWDKMVLNTGQNALSAITDFSFEQMGASKYCLDIASHLLEEFAQVAKAEGIAFDYSLMEALKKNWKGSSFHPSMWQDLHKGSRTEIDAINGAIVELGKQHKLPTPYNAMITALIKAIEPA